MSDAPGFVTARALAARTWPREQGLVTSGIRLLDRKLGGGLQPGSLTVLAGRTNGSKSFTALCMLHGVAEAGHVAAYISLEDEPREVSRRVRAAYAHERLLCAFPSPELSAVLGLLDDAADAGARVVAVDYAQCLVWNLPGAGWSSTDEMKRSLDHLKRRARSRDMALIVLSQVRRPYDLANVQTHPSLHELADSAELEKKSEVVLMLGEAQGRVSMRVLKSKSSGRGAEIALYRNQDTGAISVPTSGAADGPVVTEEW